MKIVFFESFGLDKDSLRDLFPGFDVILCEGGLDAQTVHLAKDAQIISVFINSEVNSKIIDALPNLKLITTRSTGFDHIDLDHAGAVGISVANVPAYGSLSIAHFTFGLILNLTRRITQANDHLKRSLDFNFYPALEGFELEGKTLGVVGTGRIGKNVVKLARFFGMKVLATDLFPDLSFAKENGFEYTGLPEMLAGSDIITLHAPANRANYHLLNTESISAIKCGAYLVNTARGELIDTAALLQALRSGLLSGVALDVLEGERGLKTPSLHVSPEQEKIIAIHRELLEMPNVLATPHIAFYTDRAVAEILKVTVQNILAFVSGSPVNLVHDEAPD